MTAQEQAKEINELMKPRYKVIADYPRSAWTVGRIIEGHFLNDLLKSEVDMRKYPVIFKPLEWWEDRQENDLPKYLKYQKNGHVRKVKRYIDYGGGTKKIEFEGGRMRTLKQEWTPCTEQDYINQLKT